MSRFLKVFGLALLALVLFVPGASAQRGGFRGHGGFGGHGGYLYGGPSFYGGGWGWYGPGWGYGWYNPYWGGEWGGYGGAYDSGPRYGEVKITDAAKDALVYVDGGYAGKAGDLKKFRLSLGNHDLELRDPSGHAFHQERINVLPGKTLEIQGKAGGR